jgi:hypothetical protein
MAVTLVVAMLKAMLMLTLTLKAIATLAPTPCNTPV